ncbi:MAG TPA: hypothetical protein VIU12_25695 [Chryseolinea sp.]
MRQSVFEKNVVDVGRQIAKTARLREITVKNTPLLGFLVTAAIVFLFDLAAQAQSGILLKTFDLRAGKLLLDPVRPRLYATLSADNRIAVIDTNTNTVVSTLFIGSNPVDLAISLDGTRWWSMTASTQMLFSSARSDRHE